MQIKKEGAIKPWQLMLCLVFLFNPNVNVIDILPDFVAYFALARILERAADSAPYFEETRKACVKLAWLSLAKLPAFLLIVFIRSHNTLDNDVYAMMSTIFAVLEITLLIILIKNLFSALFYLGERGGAVSLIAPFPARRAGRTVRPEALRSYTVAFAVCKCVLYALPDYFLLSRTTDSGVLVTAPLSRYYPVAIIVSFAAVLVLGAVWLALCKKYIAAVLGEGKFAAALGALARAGSEKEYELKRKRRSIRFALRLLAVATVFSFPLALTETNEINVFPEFIYGALLLLALFKLGEHTSSSAKPVLFSGGAFVLSSLLRFAFSVRFHASYTYYDMLTSKAATSAYLPVMILSVPELLAFFVFLFFALRTLHAFIAENTGLSPTSENYNRTERDYHASLKMRANVLTGLAALAALLKCVNVFLNSNVELIYSAGDSYTGVTTSSPLPWFGAAIVAAVVAYVGVAIYFSSVIKEECEMKYSYLK